MRILIAPDKFKGSLGAREVAENIAAGLRDVLPDAIIDMAPIADGGEGTAEVICDALGGSWITCTAHDPLGRPIDARYAWIDERKLAVIEMSEAAGLRRLPENERDLLRANTFGVGEMLLHATKQGAHDIIVGLGGSATNDGGFGMARALGFRFLNKEKKELSGALNELLELTRIEPPKDIEALHVIAAVDVQNPLLGERGATRVFGPQKGATAGQIEVLERALTRLAEVVAQDLGCDFRNNRGAGAAGGLGFGLMTFCCATLRPGFDVVAEAIQLEEAIRKADVIITGEGRLDLQTLEGKAPTGVVKLGRQQSKRVYAIVGQAESRRECRALFDGVYELSRQSITVDEAMKHTGVLLRERARELGSSFRF